MRTAGIGQLEQEFVRVYADTADYFMESLYENQDAGATAVLAEEGNLTQALALALESKQWDSAQILVQPWPRCIGCKNGTRKSGASAVSCFR